MRVMLAARQELYSRRFLLWLTPGLYSRWFARLEHTNRVRHKSPERSEEHTSELQSLTNLVCRLLLEYRSPPHELHPFPTRRSSDLATCHHSKGCCPTSGSILNACDARGKTRIV